jgi:hypothetical protein
MFQSVLLWPVGKKYPVLIVVRPANDPDVTIIVKSHKY